MTTPITLTFSANDAEAPPLPTPHPTGVTVKTGADLSRVQVTCPHQSGLIYAVPGTRSWVCDDELRAAHGLAGFFRELLALQDPRVAQLMQQWGLYYRSLPLERDSAAAGDGGGGP